MASESTDNAVTDEDTGPPSETNEHDYAHAVDINSTPSEAPSFSSTPAVSAQESFPTPDQPEQSASLPVELPETTVGAEVDCPGDSYVEASAMLVQTDEHPACQPAAHTAPPQRRGGRRRVNRPEDGNCSCCRAAFERHGRSFNRRAVYTFTTPEAVQWAFPDSVVHDKSFLCEQCAQIIRSKCKRKQTGKRSLWLKPPAIKQPEGKKKGRRMGKKSKAALLVSKSCYKAAFKMLWSAKGARKPMMEFWCKQLKEEMKMLSRQTGSPFHQKVSSKKPLASFPWRRCMNWAQDKAPLVTCCLRSLFPDIKALSKSSHGSQMSEEQAQTLLDCRAVVALSVPLFTRNIWKNNFLQAALGAELRLQGCSGAALDALNSMGLCQNKDTVRLLLHRLRNGKTNGRQRIKRKQEQMKEEDMSDVEEDDVEEDEEEMEEEDDEEDDDEEEEEAEIELAVEEEEVEEEEVQDRVQEEEEDEEDPAADEKEEKKRKKKAKKQRKEAKRKERGKRKAKDREEDDDEEEEEEEELEQKKRRVVVVRFGLLKGHSEVGRSDLSAP